MRHLFINALAILFAGVASAQDLHRRLGPHWVELGVSYSPDVCSVSYLAHTSVGSDVVSSLEPYISPAYGFQAGASVTFYSGEHFGFETGAALTSQGYRVSSMPYNNTSDKYSAISHQYTLGV